MRKVSFKGQMLLSIGLILASKNSLAMIPKKKKQIVVAVIDTGIDLKHPDLQKSLWTNPGESGLDEWGHDKATNGIDDDGNGFVDDVHGWNFTGSDNNVMDKIGHGTHIAGIVLGKSSLEPRQNLDSDVKVMVLKYYDPDGPPAMNILNTVHAIRYAVQMKADIINFSAGGPGFNALEKDAIEEANNAGILFVTAAGNEAINIDKLQYFPAGYRLPNILSVTAVDHSKKMLVTSNYGTKNVDVAAEGKDLVSTAPGGQYQKMTGTSQATAVVTRKAVQILTLNHKQGNSRSPAGKLAEQLLQTAKPLNSLSGKTRFASEIILN